MGIWTLLVLAAVESVRVDGGRVVATIDGAEQAIATDAGKAWVAMNGAGVFYTENGGKRLRFYRASSAVTRTVAEEPAAIQEIMQNLLPDGRWVVDLSAADGSVAAINPEGGVLLRRPAPRC